MRIFIICLIVTFTTSNLKIFGQREVDQTRTDTVIRKRPNDNRSTPASFRHPEIFTNDFLKSLPSVKLPSVNNDSIIAYLDSVENTRTIHQGPAIGGKGIKVSIDIKKQAQYMKDLDGGQIWILKISSTTAQSLSFYYNFFYLPEGATLHLYSINNKNSNEFYGPYTSLNNPKDPSKNIVFGTPHVSGNVVFLEYFETKDKGLKGKIVINNAINGF